MQNNFFSSFSRFLLQAMLRLLVVVSAVLAAGGDYNWNYDCFGRLNTENLTFVGDSYVANGVVTIGLNKTAPWSSGTVALKTPISLFDRKSQIASSFSTAFSFSITLADNPTDYGDGLAFFFSPQNLSSAPPSAAPFGLPDTFFGIIFDTRLSNIDPNVEDSHIGVNEDSPSSIKAIDPFNYQIDIKGGKSVTVWVDFHPEFNILNVFVNHSRLKPMKPIISLIFDLSAYLRDKKDVFVGFSASSRGCMELHRIEHWSFSSSFKKSSTRKRFDPSFVVLIVVLLVFLFVLLCCAHYIWNCPPATIPTPPENVTNVEMASAMHEDSSTGSTKTVMAHYSEPEAEDGLDSELEEEVEPIPQMGAKRNKNKPKWHADYAIPQFKRSQRKTPKG